MLCGCLKLVRIIIPQTVTEIGERAFEGCAAVTSITIPESVTAIGAAAFYKCDSIDTLHISDLEKWCRISFGGAFANPLSYSGEIYLNKTLITDLVIPDSITEVSVSKRKSTPSLLLLLTSSPYIQ